jgi:hypothetical protein
LINHVGEVCVRNEVNVDDPVWQKFHLEPFLQHHFTVVQTDIMSSLKVLIDRYITTHFTNDLKVRISEFPVVWHGIGYFLCICEPWQRKYYDGN